MVITVRLLNLGKVSYKCAFNMMKAIENYHVRGDASIQRTEILNTLIVTEHFPTYTVGTRDEGYNNIKNEAFLRSLGAEYIFTDRGGLITFHGPGQIVAYPVIDLLDFGISPRVYVFLLEKWMIEICKMFKINAHRSEDVGAWVGNNKIGALGVHIRNKRITTHGISLNCNINLSWFNHIVPCGLYKKSTTSISKEINRNISTDEVLPLLLKYFESIFNSKLQRLL
ncbi:hypothetical protein HZS_5868 [Henneguya salminicola]|nr:hypothetical protein HZS_5868 [Henneguya salminicola]